MTAAVNKLYDEGVTERRGERGFNFKPMKLLEVKKEIYYRNQLEISDQI